MNDPLIEDWPFPLFKLSGDAVAYANLAAQEWTGEAARKLRGQSLDTFVKAEPSLSDQINKVRESGTALTTRDCTVSTGRGEQRTCHVTIYPVEDGLGVSLWLAGPRPRQASVGGAVVTGMGRMIAHELKNPLAGIKGAAQLLSDDVKTEEGRALLELISSEIDRIRRLADRMETLGDHDPEGGQPVNVHALLRQARRIIGSAEPRISFTERYDPSLPHASGDADTLQQALLNLIKNAQEALENTEAPEITLTTTYRSGVTGRQGDNHVRRNLPIEIRVTDNGPGIPPELQDQIFQPFVTTKPSGQGLGLSLVSKVAQAHGGLVEVHSRPGKTTVSILLPAPLPASEVSP